MLPSTAPDVYDLITIGSGPGGEGATMKVTKSGGHALVIERMPEVGGGCTHLGTIPSKALRQSVETVEEFRRSPLFRDFAFQFEVTFEQLLQHARTVMTTQVRQRQGYYDRNGVRVVRGTGRLVDPHTVEVNLLAGGTETFKSKAILIATGCRPYHPPDVDFSHPHIHDSDTILSLKKTPRTITIYGAGVVGSEYASIFRSLGVKVNLINTRDRLLSFLDDEITDALSYHLRDQGVLIRHNETCESVEGLNDGVVINLKSGKKLHSDVLLWANGRTGNVDRLGLENTSIVPNSRGQIPVNESYQTAEPNIYAVGDVIGFPSLASSAYDQGRFAAHHVMHGECDATLVENVPTGIYTTPEISSLGATERELTDEKVPYEVGHALFRNMARAQITGQRVGMLKLLFHRETLQILGIHCFGHQASEILHIGQAIMAQEGEANTVKYFTQTTFNYPTMAEAYRVAALNGLNRLA